MLTTRGPEVTVEYLKDGVWAAARRRAVGVPVAFDFEIDVAASGESGYPVTVRSPGGGEATAAMRLAPEMKALVARVPDAVLASSATVRRGLSGQERPVRDLGIILFRALFGEGVHSLLMTSRQQAAMSGEQLRIVLRMAPAELACLPWEFLFDPGEDDYLCLSTPLIRRPQVLRPVRALGVTGPLRVLGMAVTPGDQPGLAADEERRRLAAATDALAGRVELAWTGGQSWRDLNGALRHGGPWHVLHFIGHGGFDSLAQEGVLILADEDGRSHALSASDLALLVEKHPSVRLVVLNACDTGQSSALNAFSSVAGALLRRGVPSVLAMQFPITDTAAIEFSRTFYEGLADRLPVDTAVTEARHAVRITFSGTLEWGTPVLYLRSRDGAIFDPQAQQGSPPPDGRIAAARERRPGPIHADVVRERLVGGGTVPLHTIPIAEHAGYVSFSPDGTMLAVASGTTVRLIDTASGQTRATLVHPDHLIRGVAFSPDGRSVATGSSDGTAVVCDTATGSRRFKIRANWSAAQLQDLAFSPDGRWLATASEDATAQVWEAASRRRLHTLAHDGVVYDLAFSPDGLLATAGFDGTARVWEVSGGRQLLTLTHSREVYGVAFSPDGRLIASGCRDKSARVWEVASGRRAVAVTHGDAVLGVAFSSAGLLATASADRTTRVWDSATGEQLLVLPHDGIVDRAVFSPDGRQLVTVTRHKCVQVWQVVEAGRE